MGAGLGAKAGAGARGGVWWRALDRIGCDELDRAVWDGPGPPDAPLTWSGYAPDAPKRLAALLSVTLPARPRTQGAISVRCNSVTLQDKKAEENEHAPYSSTKGSAGSHRQGSWSPWSSRCTRGCPATRRRSSSCTSCMAPALAASWPLQRAPGRRQAGSPSQQQGVASRAHSIGAPPCKGHSPAVEEVLPPANSAQQHRAMHGARLPAGQKRALRSARPDHTPPPHTLLAAAGTGKRPSRIESMV